MRIVSRDKFARFRGCLALMAMRAAVCLHLAVALNAAPPVFAQASNEQPPENKEKSLVEVFRRAQQLVEQDKGGTGEMKPILLPAASALPQADVATAADVPWQTFELNRLGARFDAIRFTSPLDRPADLYWVFVAPPRARWYIVTGHGEVNLYHWRVLRDLELEDLDAPHGHHTYFQHLLGGEIFPNQEYVLWFSFQHERPVKLFTKIRLVPAGSFPAPETAEDIAKVIGLRTPLKSRLSSFKVNRLPSSPADSLDPQQP